MDDGLSSEDKHHIPVLPEEVLSYLNLSPGNIIIDATVGLGGHSSLILEKIKPDGLLIGIDKDETTLQRAELRLKKYKKICRLFYADYKELDMVMEKTGISSVNGILFDLGISSFQTDTPERGFSFSIEGPLDMRIDKTAALTAYDVVNGYSYEELKRVFRDYGDERYPGRIARGITEQRNKRKISTTVELAGILKKASKGRKGSLHPEAPLFMALRIEVNQEFESIEQGLKKGVAYLQSGGRLCVISFHSGEDRIVKRRFRELHLQKKVTVLTRKPVTASKREIMSNIRSRRAKLRAVERN